MTLIKIWEFSGRIKGLKDKLRGQIGVRRMHLTTGWTMEPPAEREYAVEPVGVAKMRPSAVVRVSRLPLM